MQVMRGVKEVTSFIRIMSALLDTHLLREEVEKQGRLNLHPHLVLIFLVLYILILAHSSAQTNHCSHFRVH